jgi:hypothetical protein
MIRLDPFCGSGSMLIAAKDVDRNFIGIELDDAHYLTASPRVRGPGRRSGQQPELHLYAFDLLTPRGRDRRGNRSRRDVKFCVPK